MNEEKNIEFLDLLSITSDVLQFVNYFQGKKLEKKIEKIEEKIDLILEILKKGDK